MTAPQNVPDVPPTSPSGRSRSSDVQTGEVGAGHPRTAAPPRAHESAAKRDWPEYFKAVEGKPARDTLLKGLELFEKEWTANPGARPAQPFAVDLGCGSGRDTFELLRRSWKVLAIDATPMAIDLLLRGLPPEHRAGLETRIEGFETLTLPRADLVNASYSIPFCDPESFPRLWREVLNAIPVGSRFAGQFFGPRDDWAQLPDRAHQSRSQVDHLFQDFTLECLQEVENREAGVTGEVKNWHIFHVVAKRRV